MNKIAMALLLFVAIFLILIGIVFIIAGETDNLLVGIVLIVVSVILLVFVYRSQKIEASKPKLVNQTIKVDMGGSGQFQEKQFKCKSCGAPLTEKDFKVIQGGIMVSCPYCGTAYALEEAPKW